MRPKLEVINISDGPGSVAHFVRRDRAFKPYWHYHPELELTLITKGSGTRYVGDSIRPYSPGDLILVGSGLPHQWVSSPNTAVDHQEAHVIQFNNESLLVLEECRSLEPLFSEADRGLSFTNVSDELIKSIEMMEGASVLSRLSLILTILEELSRDSERKPLASHRYLGREVKGGEDRRMAKTTRYILNHLDEDLNLDQVADMVHLTPPAFCRWFKKESGHTLISFIHKARIEQVCHLILTSEMTIREAAQLSGFESMSHFNKIFRKYKSMSPRDFRKAKKEPRQC